MKSRLPGASPLRIAEAGRERRGDLHRCTACEIQYDKLVVDHLQVTFFVPPFDVDGTGDPLAVRGPRRRSGDHTLGRRIKDPSCVCTIGVHYPDAGLAVANPPVRDFSAVGRDAPVEIEHSRAVVVKRRASVPSSRMR